MKVLLASLILFSSLVSFAGEPKAVEYKQAAEGVVKDLYGRPGDQVYSDLVSFSYEDDGTTVEVWNVSLSNGAAVGSAAWEVTISNKGNVEEGQESANVTIKYLTGT